MSFNDVAIAIEKLGAMTSRNGKTVMLREFGNMIGFKEIMRFIYNPYIRTGIARAKLNKDIALLRLPISWQDFINHFTAHQTGSDADVAMAKTFIAQQTSDAAQQLAIAMAIKDLKCGVTATTLNQIYGTNFIPKIGIMRGEHYKDFKDKVKGPFIVTEKIDGARRLIVKENGKVTLYTRSGHVDEGLVDIEAEAQHLPDDSVFDTELMAIGEFYSALELRQATNALANSKGVRRGLTANVFDFIPLSQFKYGLSIDTAQLRKTTLGAIFGDRSISKLVGLTTDAIIEKLKIPYNFKFIKTVPILGVATTQEEIFAFAQPIWDRKFEGVMLNTVDGKYEVSSSPRQQLLKVKATEEFKLKVTGIYEGSPGTKYVGMMGGVYLDYRGNKVGCGSGFNDAQRKLYWNNPEAIIGKWVEGDSFGESKNQAGGISLNCPIFKRIVGDTE